MISSTINPVINTTHPSIGDNDSQVFRDNFANIKLNLSIAKTELSDLLSNTLRSDNFCSAISNKTIDNQVTDNISVYRYDIIGLQTKSIDIDYNNGMCQTVNIGSDIGLNFKNFPLDYDTLSNTGKLRLLVSANRTSHDIEFTATNAAIKYQHGFPFINTKQVRIPGSPGKDPVLFEVWQVNDNKSTPTICIEYVGQFIYHAPPPPPPSYTSARTTDTTPSINVGNVQSHTPVLYANGNYILSNYDSIAGLLTPSTPLDDGAYQFTYTLADQLGNESSQSQAVTVTIDTTPPPSPTVAPSSYVDDVALITGLTSTATRTNDNLPDINIVTGITDTVKLYGNNILIPASYNPTTGRITPLSTIPDGFYEFTYSLSDDLDNESGKSPAINLIIDTIPPTTGALALTYDTGVSSSDGITNNGQITVSGLESGATWEYSTNSGSTWAAGSGTTFTISAGTYTAGVVKVRQTDIAGNIQTANIATNSATITVDQSAPTTGALALTYDTGVSSSDGNSTNGSITVSGLESGATWEYSTNSGSTWAAGSGTTFTLADGTYNAGTIKVRQTDIAGNIQTANIATNTITYTIAPYVAPKPAKPSITYPVNNQTLSAPFTFTSSPFVGSTQLGVHGHSHWQLSGPTVPASLSGQVDNVNLTSISSTTLPPGTYSIIVWYGEGAGTGGGGQHSDYSDAVSFTVV